MKMLFRLLGIFLCLLLAACDGTNARIDEKADKETARALINAINQYRENRGQFPTSLDLLVPEYLSALPQTTRKKDYTYRAFHDSDRGDDYELCFADENERQDYGCCYMYFFDNPPNYDGWDCTQSAE